MICRMYSSIILNPEDVRMSLLKRFKNFLDMECRPKFKLRREYVETICSVMKIAVL